MRQNVPSLARHIIAPGLIQEKHLPTRLVPLEYRTSLAPLSSGNRWLTCFEMYLPT